MGQTEHPPAPRGRAAADGSSTPSSAKQQLEAAKELDAQFRKEEEAVGKTSMKVTSSGQSQKKVGVDEDQVLRSLFEYGTTKKRYDSCWEQIEQAEPGAAARLYEIRGTRPPDQDQEDEVSPGQGLKRGVGRYSSRP